MTLRTVSNRPVTRDDLLWRLNREIIPTMREVAVLVENQGFPVQPKLSDRAVTEEELLTFIQKQLLPAASALFRQVNALTGHMVVYPIGQRAPESLDTLVLWVNSVILARLAQARNAAIAA